MPLTESAIKALKPQDARYSKADGGGLKITVQPTGTKTWMLAYRYDGKQRLMKIGTYPNVRLTDAREVRERVKKNIALGLSPEGVNPAEPEQQPSEDETVWNDLLDRWLAKKRREGIADKTYVKLSRFADITRPTLGQKRPAEITTRDFLDVCRQEEAKGLYENSVRVKSLCSKVSAFGIAEGVMAIDATANLSDALVSPKNKSYAAVTFPADVGKLLLAIDGYTGRFVSQAALQLSALTWLRSKELRLGEWSEIDWDNALWVLPEAGRMKAVGGREARKHIVPLSRQAISILRKLQSLNERKGPYIFASSHRQNRPISNMTMNNALKSMGYDSETHVPHGFRKTASTNLNEQGWNSDWIEAQLAHVEESKVRRAYNAAEYIDHRRRMMQHYADWLDECRELARADLEAA